MNEIVVRLSGMRQGLVIAVLFVLCVDMYLSFNSTMAPSLIRSLTMPLMSIALLVWSVEEHLRKNRGFQALFSIMGALGLAYWLYHFEPSL